MAGQTTVSDVARLSKAVRCPPRASPYRLGRDSWSALLKRDVWNWTFRKAKESFLTDFFLCVLPQLVLCTDFLEYQFKSWRLSSDWDVLIKHLFYFEWIKYHSNTKDITNILKRSIMYYKAFILNPMLTYIY